MNDAIQIRAMAAADLDPVLSIASSLDAAPHWPRSAYETALDPASVPRRIALVAELSGEVIGFAVASLLPPQAELETIAVARLFQGQRVGSALLAALIRELGVRQIGEIMLEVRASNQAAQALYRAHSLVAYARRKGYYAATGEDAVLMRGAIPSPPKQMSERK